MTPVPGCSGRNEGDNYCINPDSVLQDSNGTPPLTGDDLEASKYGELDLCEGHCTETDNCKDGLVCFVRSGLSSVPGCSGQGQEGFNYCTYPTLDTKSANIITNAGSFLRIVDEGLDEGTIKVFSADGQKVIWRSVNPNKISTLDEDADVEMPVDSDVSISLASMMRYAGPYYRPDIYFKFTNDDQGGLHVYESTSDGSSDGSSVEIHSTTSIAYSLVASYEVTNLSTLSFDVTVGRGINALAICIDDGLDLETRRVANDCLILGGLKINVLGPNNIFSYLKDIIPDDEVAAGEAPDPDDIVEAGESTPEDPNARRIRIRALQEDPLANYPFQTSTVPVNIKLHTIFPSKGPAKYFTFMQVADELASATSNSLIENIQIAEDEDDAEILRRKLSEHSPNPMECDPGFLAVTDTPGLQIEKRNLRLDFCVPSEKRLFEISRNVNDACVIDTDCRSGQCVNDKCTSRVCNIDSKNIHITFCYLTLYHALL